MKIFFFIIGVALYLAALNLLVKGHKSLNLRFGWPTPSGLANNALCYFFFAAFICVVIPFAFFFHYGSTRFCQYFSQHKPITLFSYCSVALFFPLQCG